MTYFCMQCAVEYCQAKCRECYDNNDYDMASFWYRAAESYQIRKGLLKAK